jgi:hypothetical protein
MPQLSAADVAASWLQDTGAQAARAAFDAEADFSSYEHLLGGLLDSKSPTNGGMSYPGGWGTASGPMGSTHAAYGRPLSAAGEYRTSHSTKYPCFPWQILNCYFHGL